MMIDAFAKHGTIFEMSKFKFEYLALAEASVVIAIHEESKQGNFQ